VRDHRVSSATRRPVDRRDWVDTLQLTDKNGTLLPADHAGDAIPVQTGSCASSSPSRRHQRDFASSIDPAGDGNAGLPPDGRHMQSLSSPTKTDQFQRSVTAAQGAGDLVRGRDRHRRCRGRHIRHHSDVLGGRESRATMISAVQVLSSI